MTSNYIILSIRSFLEVENDKYIIICNFGGRNMSGFEVTGGPSKRRLNNSPSGLSVCTVKVDLTSSGCIAKTKSDFMKKNNDIK